MGLNKLTENLDQISESELGINFDEAAVWTRLESKLDQRKWIISPWWAAAACIVLGILSPIVVLKETSPIQAIEVNHSEVVSIAESIVELPEVETVPRKVDQTPLYEVKRKSLEVVVFDDIVLKPILEPIQINKEEKIPQFAAEDISIIQASLERPSIEKGKRITVRAQLQSFPQDVQTNQKVLKIKLYEKH